MVGSLLYVQQRRKFSVFHNLFAFFPKFHILHYFEEKEKKEFFFKKRKESLLQRIKKCPVVSVEKEPKFSIQDYLITTRSLNHRNLKKKKMVVRSDTKPQNKFWFCGLSPKFLWVSKFDVKLGLGVKIFKFTLGR